MIVDLDIATRKSIPAEALFQRWVTAAMPEGEHAVVSIRIIDRVESAKLNQIYRQKTGPTNVLSFPFEVPEGIPNNLLGDLAICAAIVEKEAKEQGKPADAHWAHIVVHGVLHLRGFKHDQDAEAEAMEALEIEILAGLGYPNPYAIEEAPTT